MCSSESQVTVGQGQLSNCCLTDIQTILEPDVRCRALICTSAVASGLLITSFGQQRGVIAGQALSLTILTAHRQQSLRLQTESVALR